MTGQVLLLGGPAAAGKSTLARAWCQRREVAAHVQLDDVRSLIVKGLINPLDDSVPGQPLQWAAAVDATCGMALAFANCDIDVAIDDLMYPADAETVWAPLLEGVTPHLVVLLPRLDVVLDRGRRRSKQVPERLVVQQYDACAQWPADRVIDTSDLNVDQSVAALVQLLDRPESLLRKIHTAS